MVLGVSRGRRDSAILCLLMFFCVLFKPNPLSKACGFMIWLHFSDGAVVRYLVLGVEDVLLCWALWCVAITYVLG